MTSVDVVMLTKNSEHLLNKCLESIYGNVPVNRLVVVDGLSTDNTLKIIEKFNKKYGNVEVITEKGSRARAREIGIGKVRTEWFLFVDSDVILCKDWFSKAERNITEDVGAVWGLNVDLIPKVKNRLLLKLLAIVARQCFNLRGGMHDTLIRHELVKDIKIPEQLHVYEDAYIINWIKKKGYKVRIGDDIYCLHLKPRQYWNLKKHIPLAALEVKCGLIYSHIFRYVFYYPFLALNWFLQFLNNQLNNSSEIRQSTT